MSFPSQTDRDLRASITPFTIQGVAFFPLGIVPDHSGVVLHDSGFLARNSNWKFANIFSPYWRLLYDEAPGHQVAFPDKVVSLGPDRIVLLPDHHRYEFREVNPAPTFWLHFSHPRRPLSQSIPVVLKPSRVELELIASIKPLHKGPSAEEKRQRIFRLSLALLQVVLARPEIRWMREKSEPLQQVMQHIAQHFREPLYNRDLARMAGLCATNFADAFRRCQGVTPAQYIAQVRVREASQLLAHSRQSVDQIAEETGFPNRAYFTRVFKRITGESPIAFRNKHSFRSTEPGK